MQNTTKIITSAFEPKIQVDSEYKLEVYMERVFKLTDSEIFIELSNVMSARHNQLQMSILDPNNFHKIQALLHDLEEKAFNICIMVIGEEEFEKGYNDSIKDFVKVMIDLDEPVASLNLDPETHGRELCYRIGKHLNIEYDLPSPASQKFDHENQACNKILEGALSGRSLEKSKDEQVKSPSPQIIRIRAFVENKFTAPIRIYKLDDDIELPNVFTLRIDETQKNGEQMIKISNQEFKLVGSHPPGFLNKTLQGFDKDKKGVRFVSVIVTKDLR
jgi:hypothetical protein